MSREVCGWLVVVGCDCLSRLFGFRIVRVVLFIFLFY